MRRVLREQSKRANLTCFDLATWEGAAGRFNCPLLTAQGAGCKTMRPVRFTEPNAMWQNQCEYTNF
jgi:hypothetical protein